MDTWAIATTLLGGVGTLAIFSFLIKENAFYRFFEHLFIGIAAGFGIVVTIRDTLYPMILVPLFGLDIFHYPDGTVSAEYDARNLLFIPAMIFGLFYYLIYSKKYNWLAKLVIGFTLGIAGGMMFEGFFTEMMPQIVGSFKPLIVMEDGKFVWGQSANNIIFVFTLIAVMYYFFFSIRPTTEVGRVVSEKLAASGRWLMMICFGAFFGSTVMARMALLVERLQFLFGPWWKAIQTVVVGS